MTQDQLKWEIQSILNQSIESLNPAYFNGSMADTGVVADDIMELVNQYVVPK